MLRISLNQLNRKKKGYCRNSTLLPIATSQLPSTYFCIVKRSAAMSTEEVSHHTLTFEDFPNESLALLLIKNVTNSR